MGFEPMELNLRFSKALPSTTQSPFWNHRGLNSKHLFAKQIFYQLNYNLSESGIEPL